MQLNPKILWQILQETGRSWTESKTPRLGAALAYYTVFAIAPLFLIALRMASLWFGEDSARHHLYGQIQGLLGEAGGKAIESMMTATDQHHEGGWATFLATATLAVAAMGVFVELQDALNTIWQVERKPGNGLLRFIKDRLLSFAMVLGIGFLLLVSLILSAGLAGLGQYVHGGQSGEHGFWSLLNFTVSLGLITVLFAMIFKFLPDVKIAWRNVWVGGFITALLFNGGKFLLGYYLGRSSVTSGFGAAGSLVVILLWVYYSAQILFFGAELTKVSASRHGANLKAPKGAHIHKITKKRALVKHA